MSPFLTVQECAEFMKVRPRTLYKWACAKRIPSRKHGGRLVFYRPEIEAWSASRTRPAVQPSLSKFQSARLRVRSLTTEVTETRPLESEKGPE